MKFYRMNPTSVQEEALSISSSSSLSLSVQSQIFRPFHASTLFLFRSLISIMHAWTSC